MGMTVVRWKVAQKWIPNEGKQPIKTLENYKNKVKKEVGQVQQRVTPEVNIQDVMSEDEVGWIAATKIARHVVRPSAVQKSASILFQCGQTGNKGGEPSVNT